MLGARQEWLQLTVEETLDPDLRICDPHHHFWNRPEERYLVDEFLQDVRSGHNIVSTVFIECREMWRKDGPEEMRPVGETEFVEQIVGRAGSTAKPRSRPVLSVSLISPWARRWVA